MLAPTLNVDMADNSDEAPPPEWIAHTEHIQALWCSDNPLCQLLTNIEDLDGTLCSLGQLFEDEHKRFLEMIEVLADIAGPTLVSLIELMAYTCLPTLLFNLHTA